MFSERQKNELKEIKREIESGKVDTLKVFREYAKKFKIPRWYDKTKNQLKLEIIFIIDSFIGEDEDNEVKEKNESEENNMEENNQVEAVEAVANEEANVASGDTEINATKLSDDGNINTITTKDGYIDRVEIGQIIAFNISRGKAMSAKIKEIRYENTKLVSCTCEAIDGTKYNVPRCSIIWVKTGKRWPRGIFEKLIAGSEEVFKYAKKYDE